MGKAMNIAGPDAPSRIRNNPTVPESTGHGRTLTINPAFKQVCRVNARPARPGREAERFADMRRKSRATNTIGISLPD